MRESMNACHGMGVIRSWRAAFRPENRLAFGAGTCILRVRLNCRFDSGIHVYTLPTSPDREPVRVRRMACGASRTLRSPAPWRCSSSSHGCLTYLSTWGCTIPKGGK